MFNKRYKSHHDVENIISKYVPKEKSSKEEFISLMDEENLSGQLGIYFHVPYCDKICSFCNMNRKKLDNDLEDYTDYLCNEIIKKSEYKFSKSSKIDVVFFGGGTPTIFNFHQLERILKTLRESFIFEKNYEMTFETTLHNLDEKKLKLMQDNGVNRLSVGIQTFSDRGRKILNRSYDKKYTIKKLEEIKKNFKGNVCIDIIYNYLDQSDEEIIEDVEILSKLGMDSSSFYSLMIHDGSQISKDLKENENLYKYSLVRDKQLHDLFYQKSLEKGYKLLEITKVTNGKDLYRYIQNNNSNKNLLAIGEGAGGHIKNIGYYNLNKNMTFYSKTSDFGINLSMISGMMQFEKFSLKEIKKYCPTDKYENVLKKFREFEKNNLIGINEDEIKYKLDGIFWGNTLVAEIIETICKNI